MASGSDEIKSEEAPIVDVRLISNLLGYAVGAARRHRGLVLILFFAIFGATLSSLFLLPKTYHVELKLLAQRNGALALKEEGQGESPTRGATETVIRRENLVAIIRQADIVHEWYNRRAPLPHVKDLIFKALRKPDADQETIEWMADVLEKRLTAFSPSEGVIQIGVDWPDPTMALRIVNAAQQNYLESRQATEITAIAERVAILQNHATALRTDIDSAVDAIEKLREDRLAKPAATATAEAAPAPRPASPPTGLPSPLPRHSTDPDPELAQLKVTIEAKQRAINDLEEFRRRRLSELNASLAEKRAMYTENHPTVIDLTQTIASLSAESPQVDALRADVTRLQKEFDQKSAAATAESRVVPVIHAGGSVGAPPPLPSSIIRIEQEPTDDRDPALMYARARLRDAIEKYSTLRAQIETTQIDFDTAEAAFKYRYSVIEPPLFPKGPSKPNASLVVLAGLLGGLAVAIFAAVAADLRSGRFIERWQVERTLGLPTLAVIDLAALAEHKIE
jgi:uncharacterized protein involved in exopolysaccharide biosynthesis